MGKLRIPGIIAVLVLVAAAGVAVYRWAQGPKGGPEVPAWDKDTCAHCAMHLGDPRFAAQIQTAGGRVYHFDDPGCLFAWRAAKHPDEAASWFHHVAEDRWLDGHDVAFISVEGSPMGYGLGAVPIGTPGAMTVEQAAERVTGSRTQVSR